MTIDMSPAAVTARVQLVAELAKLCLMLGKARPCAPGGGASRVADPAARAGRAADGET